MRTYLRQCKRCNELFHASGKFGRICNKCSLSKGGWNKATHQKSDYLKELMLKAKNQVIE